MGVNVIANPFHEGMGSVKRPWFRERAQRAINGPSGVHTRVPPDIC